MNKTLLAAILSILVLGGAVAAVMLTGDKSDETTNNESSQNLETDVMEKKDSDTTENIEDDTMEKNDDAVMMEKTSSYITLADYESDKDSYSENTNVLFFHASWCSICQGIEKEINEDPSRIPQGTTFIKTDFDSQTELRKKYGVTTQYTFVQIDNDGNQIAKWSATNLNKAIAGIDS
jgi:hypothetical protein